MITRVATTGLGIAIVRKLGKRIDPTLMRLSGGRLSMVYPFPVVLVTHTGARSGVRRTSPIVYFTDHDRVILIASSFGATRNPAWYHNMRTNPVVTLYGRGIAGRFHCREVDGAERDRLYGLATAADSPFSEYEEAAGARYIPVLALSPMFEDEMRR